VYSPAVKRARTDLTGGTIGLNPFQARTLLPYWNEMCASGPYDFVVVNGDLVDGLNRKSRGTGLWTYQLDLQAENCARLLDLISTQPDAPFFVIGGTPYHVEENPGIDQYTAELLARMGRNAQYKGQEHIFQHGRQKFHFSHYSGDAIYEGTTLSKEILFSYKHEIDITGLVRGHRHHYWLDTDGFRFAVKLPAWKGRDEYVANKGMRYARTQIGWVELLLTDTTWQLIPHLRNLKDQIPVTRIAGKTETFITEEGEKSKQRKGKVK